MTQTRPKGEQLEFKSAKTGDHILDDYLEAAERGTKTIGDMLGAMFDVSGNFDASLFEFRYDPTTSKLQFQINSEGWQDTGAYIFRDRGAHADATAYEVGDIVTYNGDTYLANTAHTSSSAVPDGNFTKIVDASLAQDWATKTDGDVNSTGEYSAKAYAQGGTGIDGVTGSAKDWAQLTGSTVDGVNYSAKHWATSADVVAVAAIDTEVAAVAGISANVVTVAGISSDVTTVAGIAGDVTTVAGDSADIATVAGDTTHIQALGPISAAIATVSGISANVSTVAGISADVSSVAGISSDVTVVAGDTTNIGIVATDLNGTDTIGTVASAISNVGIVAGGIANVNTVAGSIANVNTVAGDIANVNTAATNIASINNFADRYTISASEPGTPTEGDLWWDTVNDVMKVYDGASFVSSAAFGSLNIEDLANVSSGHSSDDVLIYNGSVYTPVALNIEAVLSRGATATTNPVFPAPTLDGHGANKLYVDTAINDLIGGAPSTLDTLNEIAAALNDDANAYAVLEALILANLDLAGTRSMTGNLNLGNNRLTNGNLNNINEALNVNTSTGTDVTVPDGANAAQYTLTASVNITLPDTTELDTDSVRTITVVVKQDATGGRVPTFLAPSGFALKWNSSASQPAAQTDANKTTIYTFTLIKGDTDIYSSLSFYEE
jgi:hypothetical protein